MSKWDNWGSASPHTTSSSRGISPPSNGPSGHVRNEISPTRDIVGARPRGNSIGSSEHSRATETIGARPRGYTIGSSCSDQVQPTMGSRPRGATLCGSAMLQPINMRRSSSLSDINKVSFCAIFLRDGSYKTLQIDKTMVVVRDVIAILLAKTNSDRLPDDFRLAVNYENGNSPTILENDDPSTLLQTPNIERVSVKLAIELDPNMTDILKRKQRGKKTKKIIARKGKQSLSGTEDDRLRQLHQAWYAGSMSQSACERQVLAGNHGHYLVRPVTKENRAFVLVVNDSGTICNFMIKAGRLGCSFGGKHYNTMKDAIAAIKSEALQGNFIEDGESLMLTYPAAGGVVLDESTVLSTVLPIQNQPTNQPLLSPVRTCAICPSAIQLIVGNRPMGLGCVQ
eukprot:m.933490 g.933490  ORF g.933490 m.933490 type:complete len:397 (+) comp23796_c0_seq5:530-1720(+)